MYICSCAICVYNVQFCQLILYFQVRGMGTALKILFSGDDLGPQSIVNKNTDGSNFQLNRVEIVSLFNAFGR